MTINREKVVATLKKCWSIRTSSKWEQDNPAKGQCPVTALVIQDHFGGRLLKTRIDGQWHFYNEVDGVTFDFTDSQFVDPIEYDDQPTSREEAFAQTNQKQYTHLSRKFSATWTGD